MLLSDYYLQKYNGAFLAVEKDHVHKSCIFTHLPNGFLEKSYLYNRLQKILNSRACDFFNRHNVIVNANHPLIMFEDIIIHRKYDYYQYLLKSILYIKLEFWII